MGLAQYNNEGEVHQGGLLISILLRYSELGTVRYFQERHAMQFTFLTTKPYDGKQLENSLIEALEVFHSLEKQKMLLCQINCEWADPVGEITVLRDMKTISQSEIGLIVELVRRSCGEGLYYEDLPLGEDEMIFQEEIISHMLANMPSNAIDNNVMAVREEGRVMLFNR